MNLEFICSIIVLTILILLLTFNDYIYSSVNLPKFISSSGTNINTDSIRTSFI